MKYLYKMGATETYVYDDSVNELADKCNGVLTLEQIEYAIQQLEQYGNKYYFVIDSLCLLLYFIKKEGVDEAIVVEKTKKWD